MGEGPTICVVIPAFNEEVAIGRTLSSLVAAGISPSDVVVVDDGSRDGTSDVARRYGVTVVKNPSNVGKAEAIGRAVAALPILDDYELLAFLDADTIVAPDYFARIAARAREHPDVALFVAQVKSQRHNWITGSRAGPVLRGPGGAGLQQPAHPGRGLEGEDPTGAGPRPSGGQVGLRVPVGDLPAGHHRLRLRQRLVRLGPCEAVRCSSPTSASPSSSTSPSGRPPSSSR